MVERRRVVNDSIDRLGEGETGTGDFVKMSLIKLWGLKLVFLSVFIFTFCTARSSIRSEVGQTVVNVCLEHCSAMDEAKAATPSHLFSLS